MSHIKISVNAWGVTDSYFSISILKFLVTLYLTVNRRGDSVWGVSGVFVGCIV